MVNLKRNYLDKLEFNQIQEKLESFCLTYIGKNLAKELTPSSDKEKVGDMLAETNQAHVLKYRLGNPPITELPDVTASIAMLSLSSTLSAGQLLELAHILKLARELKKYFFAEIDVSALTILSQYFNELYNNSGIEETVLQAIIDESTIDDRASSELMQIRKNMRKTESNIRSKLASYLNSKYIQEPVITIRSGRFVIPVKQEYRFEIKGFVYDISASGSTVFIEPMAVFDLNNELNELKLKEELEIQKILERLSALFVPIIEEIKKDVELIGRIDFAFAKAKYAIDINGTEPILSDKKEIYLKEARHPLIAKDLVVPITIYLGQTFTSLIITGPNTGGKTVTLKTVGLLCAMASSGLYIPAREGSSIFVFDYIFADIGDEQSIQESLSTFSSHMTTMIEILKIATPNSLVLLDELRFWYRPNARSLSCY